LNLLIANSRTYEAAVSVSKEGNPLAVIREATESERKYIDDIIDSHTDVFTKRHTKKGLIPKSSIAIGNYIKNNLWLLLVDNEYLIGFSIEQPWFLEEEILNEEFVLHISRGASSLKNAVNALVQVGRNLEVQHVAVGTLAADNLYRHEGLASLYEKQGFTRQAYSLMRKL